MEKEVEVELEPNLYMHVLAFEGKDKEDSSYSIITMMMTLLYYEVQKLYLCVVHGVKDV